MNTHTHTGSGLQTTEYTVSLLLIYSICESKRPQGEHVKMGSYYCRRQRGCGTRGLTGRRVLVGKNFHFHTCMWKSVCRWLRHVSPSLGTPSLHLPRDAERPPRVLLGEWGSCCLVPARIAQQMLFPLSFFSLCVGVGACVRAGVTALLPVFHQILSSHYPSDICVVLWSHLDASHTHVRETGLGLDLTHIKQPRCPHTHTHTQRQHKHPITECD